MADALSKTKALTHWRQRGLRETRHEHTREVVTQELPESARKALLKMAAEVDASNARIQASDARIQRLERMLGGLVHAALKDD